MAAAPVSHPGLSLREAAEQYLAAGMSIIPVVGGGKNPNYNALMLPDGSTTHWKEFQTRAPTPIRLAHWINIDPDTNIGIVCGAISGNLAVLDIDSPDLATWLEQSGGPFLSRTWVVRTGSGKLHIYLRSTTPVASTVLKDSNGTKVLDLRSDKEYTAAPPSRHPSGRFYETIYGDPTKISRVADVPAIARQLVSMFEAQGKTYTAAVGNTQITNVTELDDEGKRDILRKLRNLKAPNRVRAAVASWPKGPTPNEGAWVGCPSQSDVDWVMAKELRSAGLSRQECHEIYQSFPLGEQYRSAVGNRGYRYLEQTMDKADALLATLKGSAGQASGENFQVLSAVRYMGDPPLYELTLVDTNTGEQGKVRVPYEDMKSEMKFRFAVLAYMPRLLPEFKSCHAGKNWHVFVGLIARMATLESVPDEATSLGHVRSMILTTLASFKIESLIPATPGDFALGWRDTRAGVIYVRGTRLLNDLGMQLRQMPLPDTVWQIMRGLGAQQKRVKIGATSESLWVLPAASVDRR